MSDDATRLLAVPIEGPRVSLTPLTVEDADAMVEVLADPRLYEFTGGLPPHTDELRKRYAAQSRGHSPDGTQAWLNWIVRRDGHAVGYVQATVSGETPGQTAELAWLIGCRWQGLGLAAEATMQMTDWLAAQGVDQFMASIHGEHEASQAIARHLGMIQTDEVTDEGEHVWRAGARQRGVPEA